MHIDSRSTSRAPVRRRALTVFATTRFPGGTSHTANNVMTYDRVGSLELVCDGAVGYDKPNPGSFMRDHCLRGHLRSRRRRADVDDLCDASGIVSALESGGAFHEVGDLAADLSATSRDSCRRTVAGASLTTGREPSRSVSAPIKPCPPA